MRVDDRARARLAAEARCLLRAARAGVPVPGVRLVDPESGVLATEWIDGSVVRALLDGGAEGLQALGLDRGAPPPFCAPALMCC